MKLVIEIRPGVQANVVRDALSDVVRELGDISGRGGLPSDRLTSWREWVGRAQTRMRPLLTSRTFNDLILGQHYLLLQTVSVVDQGNALAFLVDAELRTRFEALTIAMVQIDDSTSSWGDDRLAVVVDTNVLLAAGPRFVSMEWDVILGSSFTGAGFVVPIKVVKELDGLKDRGSGEQRANARHALKWLDEVVWQGNVSRPLDTRAPNTSIRVWVDENDRVPLPEVDRDVIDRSLQLLAFTRNTVIVSMDRSMVMRARTYGLGAALVTQDHVPPRSNSRQS